MLRSLAAPVKVDPVPTPPSSHPPFLSLWCFLVLCACVWICVDMDVFLGVPAGLLPSS